MTIMVVMVVLAMIANKKVTAGVANIAKTRVMAMTRRWHPVLGSWNQLSEKSESHVELSIQKGELMQFFEIEMK